ncbi:putative putative tubular protein B [Pseudomonas phage Ep4]|uniref:Putative tubular protein B n=1 Tax=Pseudomonas phage Ep4 TaxID=3057492 RepID=A0AAU9E8K1_9CAUD|nr:putative putative tubular protein B [Pseudomonas phage Ep4]
MAAVDGATKSLMQGVSQQVPRERLDGQVSLQVNMLSDVVQGMRRRPGYRKRAEGIFAGGQWSPSQVFATSVDVGDESMHVLINTLSGTLAIYDDSWVQRSVSAHPYLLAADASKIHTATLRGYMYICNTAQVPTKTVSNAGKLNPDSAGFFFVRTGQYSKDYAVTLTLGGVANTVEYTTPDGTTAGDAAKATPEFISQTLLNSLAALSIPGMSYTAAGAYVLVRTTQPGALSLTSDSGTTSISTSNLSHVALVSDLPARMPQGGDGMVISVGASDKNSVYYQYSFSTNRWVESGAWNSASTLANMPMRILLDTALTVENPAYEGRLAGDDLTNEDPVFLTDGITGMGVFQGRLVLLSGPSVTMSAAGKPLRWYRSSVSELLVVDTISVYSGAATGTDFTHAVQFNKDLLLFSKTCQAVVPSGNSIVAPSTAQIVITSSYSSTAKTAPIVAGRSLMYFAPRSESFAAVLELVPSTTTDSQYTTNDVSAHIPQYMPGVVRQAAASTTSNSVAVLCDGDARTVFVQNYLWSDDKKVQSAWHSWTTPYDVACVWFVRDTLYFGLVVSGNLTVVSAEPQAGATVGGYRRPFSDLYAAITVQNQMFTVPDALRPALQAGVDMLLTYATGEVAGEWLGVQEWSPITWRARTVRNVPDGTYMLGLRYRSALSPTPPLMRDKDGIVIGTGKSTLIRYELSVQNAGEFHAAVQRGDTVLSDGVLDSVTYSSEELVPNTPIVGETGRVIIPVRANSQDTITTLYTDADHDMGVLTIEWVLQYHARRRRA